MTTRRAGGGSWGRVLVIISVSCWDGGVGGRSRRISGGGVEDLGSCWLMTNGGGVGTRGGRISKEIRCLFFF